MGQKTQELICVLADLALVLEGDGEAQLAVSIRRMQARLIDSDYAGIEALLSAYGGMGSFNDLVLGQCYEGGKFSWKVGHVALNERFSALRSRAWALANAIKGDQA